ncbi:MAG: AMP-binding protein [Schumannella sp.]
MRRVRALEPGEDALAALRDALAGGPALFPVPPGASSRAEPTVPQRVALIVETSGSTGAPKRVALSADAVLASAAASESALGGPGQWVLALPTHYIAGLNVLARSIAAGIDPVAVEGEHFTAEGFVKAAHRMGVPERFTALVPAQLATLLEDDAATKELRGFQAVLVGGQAMPVPLREAAAAAGVRVVRSYGSSETSGGCVYDGVPIGQTAVRVDDGEVWLHGPSLAEGYLGDPELTERRFRMHDGLRWWTTGDGGTWDGERLTVTGRLDDVLISGGVKVAPAAVERVLHEVPGFADAVVVAVGDARWGESPVAITTGTGDAAAAIAAVEQVLGAPARPARVIRVETIPLLPSGKPDRVALRALAVRAAD